MAHASSSVSPVRDDARSRTLGDLVVSEASDVVNVAGEEVRVSVQKDGVVGWPWTVRCSKCPRVDSGLTVVNSAVGYRSQERAFMLASFHATDHVVDATFPRVNLLSTGGGV